MMYSFTWDVSIVLKYPSTLTNDSVFNSSEELATLLAVLCGQKAREILVVIDLKDISFEEDLIIIGDVRKTITSKFHLGEFPVYHEKCVCPVEAYKNKYKRHWSIQKGRNQVIYYNHKTKKTHCLDGWKTFYKKAGIDMKIFSLPSTWSTSTSMVKTMYLLLDTVLNA